jgi:hypothetical protein
VIDPDIGRLVDSDGITICGKNLGNLQVPNNYVLLTEDGEANTGESSKVSVFPDIMM